MGGLYAQVSAVAGDRARALSPWLPVATSVMLPPFSYLGRVSTIGLVWRSKLPTGAKATELSGGATPRLGPR